MTAGDRVETGSGVPVAAEAAQTADELAQAVRAATCNLPFGAEPASFLVTLDSLAEPGEGKQ